MAKTAEGTGEALDAEVTTEAVLQPESVLWADLAGEAKTRLEKTRGKVAKLEAQLTDAKAEVARLEKEGQ